MKILISNDDGIEAPGINTLHELLSEHADCRVVAPLGPVSYTHLTLPTKA